MATYFWDMGNGNLINSLKRTQKLTISQMNPLLLKWNNLYFSLWKYKGKIRILLCGLQFLNIFYMKYYRFQLCPLYPFRYMKQLAKLESLLRGDSQYHSERSWHFLCCLFYLLLEHKIRKEKKNSSAALVFQFLASYISKSHKGLAGRGISLVSSVKTGRRKSIANLGLLIISSCFAAEDVH